MHVQLHQVPEEDAASRPELLLGQERVAEAQLPIYPRFMHKRGESRLQAIHKKPGKKKFSSGVLKGI